MELKLVVLEGAKQGLEIPLKKDKFLIGRAKECTLRAGSEAISRRHCAILRVKDRWAISDLGSRNGTYVNDKRIEKPVPLNPGDELRVGPLKFRVASVAASGAADAASAPNKRDKPRKKAPVKGVGDVLERTSRQDDDTATEEDISRWLLGGGGGDARDDATLKETRSIRLEETRTHKRIPVANETAEVDAAAEPEASGLEEPAADESQEPADDADAKAGQSSGWSLLKRGKSAAKKLPGKLPPRVEQPKNSRDAAADILREMTRRR